MSFCHLAYATVHIQRISMSKFSSLKGHFVVPFTFPLGLSSSAILIANLYFVPLSIAQVVQEVVITGNPMSKLQNTNNVSSLSGLALSEQGQSTLGETLNNLPGVSSTYFGPNASRPIVRGMDGDRIRVLSNSGTSMDVSSLSYDHAVPVDVLTTERIEVLRGPASLQYGGSAIGGVVNVIDNRIPRNAMEGVLGKAQIQTATGNSEQSKGVLLEVGQGAWVIHADAFDRRTSDVKVPQLLPCTKISFAALSNRICNSASASEGGALGASAFFDRGFIGFSVNTYESKYGTVAEDDVTIGMKSERAALKGEWRPQYGILQKLSVQASQTKYKHTEFNAGETGTVFANQGHDIRIQARHKDWLVGQGQLEGVWGMQIEQGQFSALGAEAFAPFSNTHTQALFAIEEYSVGNASFNVGLRSEQVSTQSLGNPDPTVNRFEIGTRKFTPLSLATSAAWQLHPDWRVSANASSTERAPKDYELFANGPHIATAAWERGNSRLNLEKANSFDLSALWKSGLNQFQLTAFQSRFANFIGLMSTQNMEEGLPVQIYQGVRAKFSGMEASGQWRLIQASSTLDLAWKADSVRAQNSDTNEPLPRIAPFRWSTNLIHSTGPWSARLGFDWYAAQNRVPLGNVRTDSYTLWHAFVNYKQKVADTTLNWFVKVDNLSNQWAYSATSILTSTAPGKSPLPGRSLKLGVVAAF
jgi:iron complex outermembrane receptor protein